MTRHVAAAAVPPKVVRYHPTTALWQFAATDARLSDRELRVYLVAVTLSNMGQALSLTALAAVLGFERDDLREPMQRLVELRYMIDRQMGEPVAVAGVA